MITTSQIAHAIRAAGLPVKGFMLDEDGTMADCIEITEEVSINVDRRTANVDRFDKVEGAFYHSPCVKKSDPQLFAKIVAQVRIALIVAAA